MKPSIISVFDKTEISTGAHKRHLGLLKELNRRDYKITLFSPVNFLGQDINHFELPEVKKSFLPMSVQTFLFIKKVFADAKDRLPPTGVILVFGFNHIYASWYLKWQLNLPLIFVARGDIYKYRKTRLSGGEENWLTNLYSKIKNYGYLTLFKQVEKHAYKKSDLIIVQSKKDFKNLANNYYLSEKKIRIIRNNINFFGPDNPSFQNNSTSLNSVIFVGSLSKRKGVMYLLKAIRDLKREKKEVKLEILGDGKLLNDVLTFVSLNGMEANVTIHGYIDNPIEYIADADLMIMPSIMDSFPNSVLEALYVGTPVIGSDTGGISEILQYDSLLFKPGSPLAIKDKVRSLLDEKVYSECKKACIKRRKEFLFDWTGKFEKVITDITH